MNFPTVEEWVAHPDALDNILRDMAVFVRRYEAKDERGRMRMAGTWANFVANERASGRLPGLEWTLEPWRPIGEVYKRASAA